uniref:Polysaccharide pyruvyl transferase domain-containing protein n=1 Tax=Attheya septentrionalis TaxID=420275 RepID=A0A7S2XNG5_9STRA|mmetsp:Transcript_24421/g.44171  ORF Transcript_24421/g.44171 Transcript_24421/m.44171 type:complete len:848 (+) Transcript_24421:119-2662(+)
MYYVLSRGQEGRTIFSPDLWKKSGLVVGILHFLGCLCTNMGFAFGSASVVQIIKLLEPIETLLLTAIVNVMILQKFHGITFPKTLAVVTIIGGTSMLLSKKGNADVKQHVNLHSVVFSLCSGLAMATRNVVKRMSPETSSGKQFKEIQSWKDTTINGLINFFSITFVAAIPATFCLILAELRGSSHINGSIVIWMLNLVRDDDGRNAILFHGLYNISSISVLSLMSAQSHSLLNVGKRIFNVLYADVVFQEPIGRSGIIGLCIAAVGGALYSCGSNDACTILTFTQILVEWKNIKKMKVVPSRTLVPLFIVLLLCTFETLKDATRSVEDDIQDKDTNTLNIKIIGTKACFSNSFKEFLETIPSTQASRDYMKLLTNFSAFEIDDVTPNSMVLAKCPLLIPKLLVQECLSHHLKPRNIEWPTYLVPTKLKLAVYLEKGFVTVERTDDNDQLARMLNLVLIILSRAIPILGQSDVYFASIVSKFGIIYFQQNDDGSRSSWRVCGSSKRTRSSLAVKTDSVPSECLIVEGGDLIYDKGIADSNFGTIMKIFSLDLWSLSKLDKKYEISVPLNERNEVVVYITAGKSWSNNIGDQFGVNVASHMLISQTDTHSVIAGIPSGIAIVGSIVSQLLPNHPGVIHWGVGLIRDGGPPLAKGDSKVLCVRGPRTRDWLLLTHGLNPLVISDPATTASDIFPIQVLKNNSAIVEKEVCFVIHAVDRKEAFAQCPLCEKFLVNNYGRDIKGFLADLLSCKRVVSSSLHGVIFSHSFDIPALPVVFGDGIIGGDFKFIDYMHSIGMTSFQGRVPHLLSQNLTLEEWSALVDGATHPEFPLDKTQFYQTFPGLDKQVDLK